MKSPNKQLKAIEMPKEMKNKSNQCRDISNQTKTASPYQEHLSIQS